MNSKTKNDIAWEQLFFKFNILIELEKNIVFLITADQIREFREPRLMTKFDHKKTLPSIFKKHNLSIIPLTRGTYLLSYFDAYYPFDDEDYKEVELKYVDFPENIVSIDYENISSEAGAIHCAYLSGIFNDFLDVENLNYTFSGRMSSGTFTFNIWNHKIAKDIPIKVENSQVEIDAGFETSDSLIIVEAKNSVSSDFLIRQLFYPYKLWLPKVPKRIRLIFMIYTNGVFKLYEYFFNNAGNYNSLKLVKHKNYGIGYFEIDIIEIEEILNSVKKVKEPKVPFPQADSFDRIINLLELLNQQNELNREEITLNYDFDVRQTNYYSDAGRYLGLIDKKNDNKQVVYFLTSKAHDLFKLNIKNRQLKLVELILEHNVFAETLKLYLQKLESPTTSEIINIMVKSDLYNVSAKTTYIRRSRTIQSWIDWILDLRQNISV